MLLITASAAITVAAVMFAALLPPRGTIAFLGSAALATFAIVVTSVGVAGLVLRTLSPAALTTLAVVSLVAVAITAAAMPSRRAEWPARLRGSAAAIASAVRFVPAAVALALVVAALAWRTFLALRLPIVDYDGWSYHMVFVDVWLQHDALTLVPQRLWTAGYPANSELIAVWLAAFTHSDWLTGFSSLAPIPLAIVATAGIARLLGGRRPAALLAGLLFGLTPALLALAGTTYVDAGSVAFVAASWWLGLRVIAGERSLSVGLLLGIAAGLAMGTKGTNIVLVLPVVAAAAALFVLQHWRGDPVRASAPTIVVALATLGLPIVLLGASWYLKNVAVYGNPLYPFAVGPFHGPTTLTEFTFVPPQLEGHSLPSQLVRSWLADWQLTRYAYNVRPGGLGRAWPFLLMIAVAGVALLLRRRRFAPLALVVVPVLFTLVTMPMPWYARLTLFLPAIAAPLALLAVDALRPRPATAAALLLVAVASISAGFANLRANIDVSNALGSAPATVTNYLGYVFDPSVARRADVSLRHECAGFGVIPNGSVVAPAGFNLLHGVVGPNLERALSDPLAAVTDGRGLAAAADAAGASWLVTSTGGTLDALARSAPELFVDRGDICQGAHLWQRRLPG